MNKKKGLISFVIAVLFFSVMLVCNLYGEALYKAVTVNGTAFGIGPAFIEGAKYQIVINDSDIRMDESGKFIYLVKSKKTFWYDINYIEKAYIEIIKEDKNSKKSAVIFTSGNYINSDPLLRESNADSMEFLNGDYIYIEKR